VKLGASLDLLLDVAFRRGVMTHLYDRQIWRDPVLLDSLGDGCFHPRIDFVGHGLAQHENGSLFVNGGH